MRTEVARGIAQSPMTVLLVFLGGVGTMTLWLKVSLLIQQADQPQSETTWLTVTASLLLGGLLAAVSFVVWSRVAPRIAAARGSRTSIDRVRVAWAFSDFPLAIYVSIMVPLDLLLVGPEIFSSETLEGSFAVTWSALSVGVLLAATAWSVFLFVKGLVAAAGRPALIPLAVTAGIAVWIFYVIFKIVGGS